MAAPGPGGVAPPRPNSAGSVHRSSSERKMGAVDLQGTRRRSARGGGRVVDWWAGEAERKTRVGRLIFFVFRQSLILAVRCRSNGLSFLPVPPSLPSSRSIDSSTPPRPRSARPPPPSAAIPTPSGRTPRRLHRPAPAELSPPPFHRRPANHPGALSLQPGAKVENEDRLSKLPDENEDRLSKLPDDILLDILGKGKIHTCIRSSFLSTRWRHLPSLLSHISLDISDFMGSGDSLNPTVIDKAMKNITKVARISLDAPAGRKGVMKEVSLRLLLTTKHLYDTGRIVSEAIDNGEVKSVELALPTVKLSFECSEMDVLQHGKDLICFFNATTTLFRHLSRLFLHNARLNVLQMHCLLNSCKQLQHLVLNNCDTGDESVLKIDMPNSKLSYLKLYSCCFEKVEFLCLPKLSELHYELWYSLNTPFSFGIVPCLEEVRLVCKMASYQSGYNLSELLHGTKEIHALTLDFEGEKVWMLPEGQKLHSLFKKLSKLFIHGIYAKFGLSWTITLLEAAPFIKTFGIKVCDHVCTEKNRILYAKRINPWQKNNKLNSSRHLNLTRLEFGGFMAVKKHLQFVTAIMDYAPSLKTILLEDKDPCEYCDEVNSSRPHSSTGSTFPKNKRDQEMTRNQLGVGSCSVQISFK